STYAGGAQDMKNWTKPAITILTLAALGHVTSAQSGGDRMAGPMSKSKTYVGCVVAGASAGTFTLTQDAADMGMDKDAMGDSAMGKDMGKEAMTVTKLAISSKTIDLSRHVGHTVSVTGDDRATSMGMAKEGEMGKGTPAVSITSIKTIAESCT